MSQVIEFTKEDLLKDDEVVKPEELTIALTGVCFEGARSDGGVGSGERGGSHDMALQPCEVKSIYN